MKKAEESSIKNGDGDLRGLAAGAINQGDLRRSKTKDAARSIGKWAGLCPANAGRLFGATAQNHQSRASTKRLSQTQSRGSAGKPRCPVGAVLTVLVGLPENDARAKCGTVSSPVVHLSGSRAADVLVERPALHHTSRHDEISWLSWW
jgi:hypothetical protein